MIEELYPDLAPTIAELADEDVKKVALTMAACAEGYRVSGFNLAYINSVSSVFDIQSLADALGYTGQYNLLGTSYGTRLALDAMRTTPDRVRAAVLDGIIPPNVRDVYYTDSLRTYAYQTIFAGCEADPDCNEAYPNIEQSFIAMLARLQTDPIVFDPPLQANQNLQLVGVQTIAAIDPKLFVKFANLNNMAAGGAYAQLTPRLILAIENNEIDLLRAILSATPGAEAQEVTPIVATEPQVITPDSVFFAKPINELLSIAQINAADVQSAPDLWLKLVIDELVARLDNGEAQAGVIQDLIQLLLPLEGTNAGALVQFAQEHTSAETAVTLNTIVGQMTRIKCVKRYGDR